MTKMEIAAWNEALSQAAKIALHGIDPAYIAEDILKLKK